MTRIIPALLITAISLSSTLFAQAPSLTGTWVGVVRAATPGGQAPSANGGPLPFIVHINQTGETVTGTIDGIGGGPNVDITDGKVAGNVLTFVGIREINGQDVKFTYTGTLTGDKLEFRIERDGANPLASTTTRLTTAF